MKKIATTIVAAIALTGCIAFTPSADDEMQRFYAEWEASPLWQQQEFCGIHYSIPLAVSFGAYIDTFTDGETALDWVGYEAMVDVACDNTPIPST